MQILAPIPEFPIWLFLSGTRYWGDHVTFESHFGAAMLGKTVFMLKPLEVAPEDLDGTTDDTQQTDIATFRLNWP